MATAPFEAPRTRVRRHLEEAERDQGIAGVPAGANNIPGQDSSVPPVNASSTDKKTGISFFKGRKANTAESNAKKNALVNKLRQPTKFKGSSFGGTDASDADSDDEDS